MLLPFTPPQVVQTARFEPVKAMRPTRREQPRGQQPRCRCVKVRLITAQAEGTGHAYPLFTYDALGFLGLRRLTSVYNKTRISLNMDTTDLS